MAVNEECNGSAMAVIRPLRPLDYDEWNDSIFRLCRCAAIAHCAFAAFRGGLKIWISPRV